MDAPAILLSFAALAAGVAAVVVSYRSAGKAAFFVLKPLTTLLILGVALLSGSGGYGRRLVASGLLFATLGDVLLMLPERYFVGGVLSFAATHFLYLAAFISVAGPALVHPVTLLLGLAAALLLHSVWGGVPPALRLPIVGYVVLITAMAAQAVGGALDGQIQGATVAAAGALLFFTSDSVLALDRFRSQFTAARAIVLSTYWVGQWLIAVSAGLMG